MKIIVSGGGTGGHIYPALTIADTIKKLYPEAEIRFVGTTHGLDCMFIGCGRSVGRDWSLIPLAKLFLGAVI